MRPDRCLDKIQIFLRTELQVLTLYVSFLLFNGQGIDSIGEGHNDLSATCKRLTYRFIIALAKSFIDCGNFFDHLLAMLKKKPVNLGLADCLKILGEFTWILASVIPLLIVMLCLVVCVVLLNGRHFIPVRRSRILPERAFGKPPQCLKKKGTLASRQGLVSLSNPVGIYQPRARADSPPAITQSMPLRGKRGIGPNSGSTDKNRIAEGRNAGDLFGRCSLYSRHSLPSRRSIPNQDGFRSPTIGVSAAKLRIWKMCQCDFSITSNTFLRNSEGHVLVKKITH